MIWNSYQGQSGSETFNSCYTSRLFGFRVVLSNTFHLKLYTFLYKSLTYFPPLDTIVHRKRVSVWKKKKWFCTKQEQRRTLCIPRSVIGESVSLLLFRDGFLRFSNQNCRWNMFSVVFKYSQRVPLPIGVNQAEISLLPAAFAKVAKVPSTWIEFLQILHNCTYFLIIANCCEFFSF